MKFRLLAALAICGLFGVQCVSADNAADDEAAIGKTIAQYEEGWNTHNGRELGMCFTDDADFINILGGRMNGKAEIEKELTLDHSDDPRASFRHSTMRLKIEKITFLAANVAVVIVSFPLTGTGIASIDGAHIGVRVMQKVNDRWLIETFENTKVRKPS